MLNLARRVIWLDEGEFNSLIEEILTERHPEYDIDFEIGVDFDGHISLKYEADTLNDNNIKYITHNDIINMLSEYIGNKVCNLIPIESRLWLNEQEFIIDLGKDD